MGGSHKFNFVNEMSLAVKGPWQFGVWAVAAGAVHMESIIYGETGGRDGVEIGQGVISRWDRRSRGVRG